MPEAPPVGPDRPEAALKGARPVDPGLLEERGKHGGALPCAAVPPPLAFRGDVGAGRAAPAGRPGCAAARKTPDRKADRFLPAFCLLRLDSARRGCGCPAGRSPETHIIATAPTAVHGRNASHARRSRKGLSVQPRMRRGRWRSWREPDRPGRAFRVWAEFGECGALSRTAVGAFMGGLGVKGLFLKRVRVRNFKSFADADLELGGFNVLIGANASGKSNLVQILRFLRDIGENGLDAAVSMQGGSQYVRNLRLAGKSTVIELEIEAPKARVRIPGRRKIYSAGGRWRLEFVAGEGREIRIIEDSWTFDVCEQRTQTKRTSDGQLGYLNADRRGIVNVTQDGGRLRFETDLDGYIKDALGRYTEELHAGKNELLVESGLLGHFFPMILRLKDIGMYDFDSKLAGNSAPIKGMPELKDDGSNLALVLKYILDDDESKERLRVLVSDMLPFVKSIGVRDFAKSVTFTVAEERLEKTPLPSSLLSYGTVGAVAVVVSLYFGEKPVMTIEEPERNMHPSLMARMTDMMRDASEDRQIIITTHSPEIVRYAGIENLYAIKKGPEGFSEISRPSANREIMEFVENDVGVAEMYVQNMLER